MASFFFALIVSRTRIIHYFCRRKRLIFNKMGEDKSFLLRGAMNYGFVMGIYWVIKYVFFILGFSHPTANIVYWSLSCLVPYIAYKMTRRYRENIGGKLGFFHAWQFGVLLYFFAAILVSLEHYLFYRFIAPPDLLMRTVSDMEEALKESGASQTLLAAIKEIRVTPIQMAIQGIFNNLLYGIILSIPVALLARGESSGKMGGERV